MKRSYHHDVRGFGHKVRIVYDRDARGGMFSPEVHLHLSGPNGSVSGFGPKWWPKWCRKVFVGAEYDFGGMLTIRVPHLRWKYPQGRIRTKLYKLQQKVFY